MTECIALIGHYKQEGSGSVASASLLCGVFKPLWRSVNVVLRTFSINVRFARAGEAFIVFDAGHARVSRFSKPAPPAREKRLQWKIAFRV
jgi:hypothetical protein